MLPAFGEYADLIPGVGIVTAADYAFDYDYFADLVSERIVSRLAPADDEEEVNGS